MAIFCKRMVKHNASEEPRWSKMDAGHQQGGDPYGIDPNQKSIYGLGGQKKVGGVFPKKDAPTFEPTLGSTFGHDFVHEKAVLLTRLLGISLG